MKRRGLVHALQARKDIDREPERKGSEPATKADPVAKPKTPARFHTSLYPDRQMYDDIKVALIREGKGRDFNTLVNDLLAEWLDAHGE
jgi:hypothetical protein